MQTGKQTSGARSGILAPGLPSPPDCCSHSCKFIASPGLARVASGRRQAWPGVVWPVVPGRRSPRWRDKADFPRSAKPQVRLSNSHRLAVALSRPETENRRSRGRTGHENGLFAGGISHNSRRRPLKVAFVNAGACKVDFAPI